MRMFFFNAVICVFTYNKKFAPSEHLLKNQLAARLKNFQLTASKTC